VYLRAITSGKASSNVRLTSTYVTFDGGITESETELTQFVNNLEQSTIERTILENPSGGCDNILFKDTQAKQGWKVQPRLKWQNEAKVAVVEVMGEEMTNQVSLKQRSQLSNT